MIIENAKEAAKCLGEVERYLSTDNDGRPIGIRVKVKKMTRPLWKMLKEIDPSLVIVCNKKTERNKSN